MHQPSDGLNTPGFAETVRDQPNDRNKVGLCVRQPDASVSASHLKQLFCQTAEIGNSSTMRSTIGSIPSWRATNPSLSKQPASPMSSKVIKFKQHDITDCGAASLASVAAFR